MIVVAAHHLIVLVGMGKLLYQGLVLLALVVGALGQLVVHLLDACLQLADVLESLLGLLHHRARIAEHHHLWQVSHRNVFGYGHTSTRGRLQTGQYLQQGAFARTIFANQSNAVFLVDHKRHIRKQWLSGKLHL